MCCHRRRHALGSETASATLAPALGTPLGDPVPLLNVALVPAPGQVVVRLSGDADLSTVPLLADALAQAASLGTRDLVVDVAAARFWDSAALRALATISSELVRADRGCRIVGAGRATRGLIRAADLADCLELDGPVVERAAPEPPAGPGPEPGRPPAAPAAPAAPPAAPPRGGPAPVELTATRQRPPRAAGTRPDRVRGTHGRG